MRADLRSLLALVSLLSASGLLAAPASAVVTIEWVTVGSPGNAPDAAHNCHAANCGSVAETYRISKYEITNAQYAEFLNSVANEFDPFALYHASMPGIAFPAVPVGFERFYEVRPGFANKPVTFVSFYDALRFTNWMHNGQGSGDTETGGYTLVGGTATPSSVLFNAGASILLPSENEWYKAAYYDAASASYFDYPARSNTATTCSAPEATPNSANCNFAAGGVTDVGAYTGSASPFGTFDQGGNVWEWNEQIVGIDRGARGGSWSNIPATLAVEWWSSASANTESGIIGFRVASLVPEPDAGGLGMAALSSLAALRRRFQCGRGRPGAARGTPRLPAPAESGSHAGR